MRTTLLVVCFSAVACLAQSPADKTITTYFSVLAKDGGAVRPLSPADFELKGARLLSVEPVSVAPKSYTLLIDVSNSERTKFQAQTRAAKQILTQVFRPQVDTVQMGIFDTVPEFGPGFIQDAAPMLTEMDKLRPGGGTALFDALIESAARVNGTTGPRVLLLFTDGEDNQSHSTIQETTRSLVAHGVMIYSFSSSDESNRRGRFVLRRFTEATGGASFEFDSDRHGTPKLDGILSELKGQLANLHKVQLQVPGQATAGKLYRLEVHLTDKKLRLLSPSTYSPQQ